MESALTIAKQELRALRRELIYAKTCLITPPPEAMVLSKKHSINEMAVFSGSAERRSAIFSVDKGTQTPSESKQKSGDLSPPTTSICSGRAATSLACTEENIKKHIEGEIATFNNENKQYSDKENELKRIVCRTSRRGSKIISYREPSLKVKLRQGDNSFFAKQLLNIQNGPEAFSKC